MTRRGAELATLPSSHLEAMAAAGFEALSWLNVARQVAMPDGEARSEWLPRDLVNWERRQFVQWRDDDAYCFAGWEPKQGHHFGGRYPTVQGALAWFSWLEKQA